MKYISDANGSTMWVLYLLDEAKCHFIDLPISRHDGANKLRSANNARVLYLDLGTTVERENKHIQKISGFYPSLENLKNAQL